ncbi:hypothetical protein [Paenibacillus sp. 1A_MP2]|uniref:hypothetical protein n=1 Tax=Paenibacillus sp. 1A_MP2 TaxID=3457495 RepID=UPI003FCDA8F9
MNKPIRSILLVILFFILSFGVSAAAETTTGMKPPDYSDSFRLIPDTEGFETPDPSFFVWETGGILGSIIGYLSNILLLVGTSSLKMSIWILDKGLHPKWLNSTIDSIAGAAHTKGWDFVDNLWPFIVIGAFILVGKDFIQGSMATTIKRLMTFGISLVVMASLLNMPSTAPAKGLTAVVDFSDWISMKFMSVFSDTDSNTIYGSVWDQMANRPFEAGQFGDINTKITAEDAEKINKAIEPYAVVSGMRWVDAVLWFAPDTDERGDIIDIYSDNYEKKYESAKNPYSRLGISFVALLCSILSALFLFVMGGIMLILVGYFLALIIAGIIVLPLGLVPTKEPVMVMKYLQRILGVFMTVVFIFLYIGVTLLLTNIVTLMENVEFLFCQLLVMLIFVAALILFFVLISKMQSSPGLKHMNDVLRPINKAGSNFRRRYGRNRRARALDDMYDDDEFEDYADQHERKERISSNIRERKWLEEQTGRPPMKDTETRFMLKIQMLPRALLKLGQTVTG